MAQKNESFILRILRALIGGENDYQKRINLVQDAENERLASLPSEQTLLENIHVSRGEYASLDSISQLRPGIAHLHGIFKQVSARYARRGMHVTDAIFEDDTGSVRVVWFNRPYIASSISKNVAYELVGKFELSRSRFTIINPRIQSVEMGCFTIEPKVLPTPQKAVKSFNPTFRAKELETHGSNMSKNVWTEDVSGKGLTKDSKWDILRQKVFKRDGYKCVNCGETQNLTVDHIKELSIGGKNTMNNLRTLCKDCHEERHLRKFLESGFDANDNYGEDIKLKKKVAFLDEALRNDSSLSISYKDKDGVRSYRVIHPKNIYKGFRGYYKDQVYVDAFCELDNDDRTFRVSRMKLSKSGRSEYIDKPIHH